MKEVMKNAWEIAREAVKKFGGKVKEYIAEALKLAWAEFKTTVGNEFGRVQLQGSEKQVAWAEDLRGKLLDELYDVVEVMKDEKRFEEEVEELKEFIKEVEEETSAKWIIENQNSLFTAFYNKTNTKRITGRLINAYRKRKGIYNWDENYFINR